MILNFADGTSETINLSTLLSDEIAAIELRLDAIEVKNRAQDTKFSEYYTKTESDANDAATLTAAADAVRLFTFDKGTISDKDAETLTAAKEYTDNSNSPPQQFALSKTFNAGDTFYYGTANRVLLFLVRPGQTFHGTTDAPGWTDSTWSDYIFKEGNTSGKILLIADVSNVGHITSLVNAVDDDNMLTTTINYMDSEDQAVSVVSDAIQLPSGGEGGNKLIEALLSEDLFTDMQWEAEVQTYDDASAPTSPATIGIAFNSIPRFGIFFFDFIVPTAITKSDLEALVLQRELVFDLPEGVIRVKMDRDQDMTAVITGGYHRERYTAVAVGELPDGITNTNSNNDYQTTLYRVKPEEIPGHSVRAVRKKGTDFGDKEYFINALGDIDQRDEYYIINPTASELTDINVAHAGKYVIWPSGEDILYIIPDNGDVALVYADRQVDITDTDGNVSTANENRIVAILIYEGGNWVITNSYFKIANNPTETGAFSNAEGNGNTASGVSSHAEGSRTIASGDYSHTEGNRTNSSGDFSHAEGILNVSSGNYSHAEGSGNTASGLAAHVEGTGNAASGRSSHAEGEYTTAKTDYSTISGYRGVVANLKTVAGIAYGSSVPSNAQRAGSEDVGLVWKVDQTGNTIQTGTVTASGFKKTGGVGLRTLTSFGRNVLLTDSSLRAITLTLAELVKISGIMTRLYSDLLARELKRNIHGKGYRN